MTTVFQDLFRTFRGRWELIKSVTYKELTDRYAGSAFGLLLSIIQPMLLIGVYTLVFTFVFKVRMSGANESPLNYAFYVIAGLIPWMAISESIAKSVTSITTKDSIVKQAIFPTEILPIATALSSLWPLVVSFIIYLVIGAFLVPQHLSWYLLLLPIIFVIQALFAMGLGWFLAILGVYFRDIGELIGVLLTVGMFVTPILYLEDMIPAAFVLPMKFNPFAHLIYMYRDVAFYGRILHPWSFLIFTLLAIILLLWGFITFKKVKHLFANVL